MSAAWPALIGAPMVAGVVLVAAWNTFKGLVRT